MANVLNRTTNEFLVSVNTPDYDPAAWVINPDLSEVSGYPTRYWIINADDSISLMTADQQHEADLTASFQGLTVSQAVEQKCVAVNAYRDNFLSSGWSFNGVEYDSDPIATQNIAGTQTLINAGYTLPSNFVWRSKDNSNHPFDNTSFLWFYIASCQWRSAAFTTSWNHKSNIAALSTITDIANYDFTVGWVQGYNVDQNGLTPVTD